MFVESDNAGGYAARLGFAYFFSERKSLVSKGVGEFLI